MTFKESYNNLTEDGKKIIDQLDGTNDAESAEKIADQYLKLKIAQHKYLQIYSLLKFNHK